MGCCVSSHEKSKTTPKINTTNTHEVEFPCESKSPPIAEEEAVKEVLSETPKPRIRPDSRPASPKKRAAVFEGDVDDNDNDNDQPIIPKVMVSTPKKAIPEQKMVTKRPDPVTPEEISEVSEMCSFSEGISNTTLKEDDDHQFHQHNKDTAASGEPRQRVFRSQGYNGHFHHHQHHQQHQQFHQQQHCKTMGQGRSQARRRPDPESSPVRRRQAGPVGPKREVGGENNNSGRRTQSPGKRANVGRIPSGRRTGPSPDRVRMVGGPDNGRKVEDRKEEEEEARRESEEWQGPKESLENPLVSLECFIFL